MGIVASCYRLILNSTSRETGQTWGKDECGQIKRDHTTWNCGHDNTGVPYPDLCHRTFVERHELYQSVTSSPNTVVQSLQTYPRTCQRSLKNVSIKNLIFKNATFLIWPKLSEHTGVYSRSRSDLSADVYSSDKTAGVWGCSLNTLCKRLFLSCFFIRDCIRADLLKFPVNDLEHWRNVAFPMSPPSRQWTNGKMVWLKPTDGFYSDANFHFIICYYCYY